MIIRISRGIIIINIKPRVVNPFCSVKQSLLAYIPHILFGVSADILSININKNKIIFNMKRIKKKSDIVL